MEDLKKSLPKNKTANENEPGGYNAGLLTILTLGLYLILLSSLFLYLLIKLWPEGDASTNSVVIFNVIKLTIGNEIRLILLIIVMGGLGSLIHVTTSFATYIGNRRFIKSWTWWYISRPFIGMPLALIFYFVVRGGFFALSSDTKAVSTFGIAGLSGLVGMFSKQAIDKLREIFDNLFKTTQKDERTDKL